MALTTYFLFIAIIVNNKSVMKIIANSISNILLPRCYPTQILSVGPIGQGDAYM